MDFGHFGDGPRDQNGGQNQTPVTPTPQNGANGGQSNNGTEQPIFMHTMAHPGVTCDVCSGEIRGFRYKCMECVDFDLCTTCERKGNHPGHVMMRIAFPEQTRGAMQRFLGTTGIGFGRHHGGGGGSAGLFGVGFPFETQGRHHWHHRDRGCHRRAGHASGRDSEGDSGPEDPKGPNDCPYGLGRKGMKKWAKCMKKMAYQHRRSAEAYAKSATQAATGAAAAAAGFSGHDSEPRGSSEAQQQQAFDFTSAASQIQEFLNAFGIPIDVVELYDNYGNRGQPRTEPGNSTTSQPMATPTGNTAENATHGTESANEGQEQQSTTNEGVGVPQTNLAAHMQQLHLSGQGIEPVVASAPSAPEEVSAAQSVNMDLDADSSGWTLLDTDRAPGSVGAQQNESSIFGPPPAAATISNGQSSTPATTATTTTTTGIVPPAQTPTGRLYPGLNPPQLQQLLSGVSQAMNSMVRNIPIVTNPGGPGLGTNSGPPSYGNGSPEMDIRCTTTLNQLLAMGFSNADGWLSRLVVAKNGDLETILNALFPVGGGQ